MLHFIIPKRKYPIYSFYGRRNDLFWLGKAYFLVHVSILLMLHVHVLVAPLSRSMVVLYVYVLVRDGASSKWPPGYTVKYTSRGVQKLTDYIPLLFYCYMGQVQNAHLKIRYGRSFQKNEAEWCKSLQTASFVILIP